MKTTTVILLILFSGIITSPSCSCIKEMERCYTMKVDNKSDRDVYVAWSYDYPDTSINFQNPMTTYALEAHRVSIGGGFCKWPSPDETPANTLSIFFFDAAEVQASWTQVRQQYRVLKRIDYNLDDVRNRDFTVEYE